RVGMIDVRIRVEIETDAQAAGGFGTVKVVVQCAVATKSTKQDAAAIVWFTSIAHLHVAGSSVGDGRHNSGLPAREVVVQIQRIRVAYACEIVGQKHSGRSGATDRGHGQGGQQSQAAHDSFY